MTIDAYRTYFDAIEKEANEVPLAELLRVNIDPEAAVLLVVGVLPRLMALREEIRTQLPNFRISHLEKLEAYTKGLGHAHALHLAANAPSKTVPELASRARRRSWRRSKKMRARSRVAGSSTQSSSRG